MIISDKDIIRFWSKVTKRESEDCWLWNRGVNSKGYGVFMVRFLFAENHAPYLAHRLSMMLFLNRRLSKSECVLHDCPNGDNRACVNPKHLWLGTRADNNKDMMKKGRFRHHNLRGELVKIHKVSGIDVVEIRRLYFSGKMTGPEIASQYKLHHSTIYDILSKKTWSHVL